MTMERSENGTITLPRMNLSYGTCIRPLFSWMLRPLMRDV